MRFTIGHRHLRAGGSAERATTRTVLEVQALVRPTLHGTDARGAHVSVIRGGGHTISRGTKGHEIALHQLLLSWRELVMVLRLLERGHALHVAPVVGVRSGGLRTDVLRQWPGGRHPREVERENRDAVHTAD